MAQMRVIDGGNLTIDDIWAVAYDNAKITVAPKNRDLVEKSRLFVEQVGQSVVTYGVNTGFGPMAQYILSKKQVEQLQYNLIRSHATGLGEPLSEEQCIAVMLVRLNTLVRGRSGVRWKVIKQLEKYINNRVVPVIPYHGSVGASGDLVQLAHVALGLIGEGKVYHKGKIRTTRSVLKMLKWKPMDLEPKEGLALINGTSCMAALGALLCYQARRQFDLVLQAGAMAYELMGGFDDPISRELQQVRPHVGQVKVAAEMRKLLRTSKLTQRRSDLVKKVDVDLHDVRKIDHKVQDVYSIRCMPQIYGPVYDTLKNTIRVIEIEINSVTDNPITNGKNDTLLHGGNFHGDYVSLEMDKLKIVLTRVALTLERHVNVFLNPNVRDHLPPFLNLRKPGLDIALQGLQFVATSTTAELQTLSFPNYVHTITTNADNQDIVSMGTNSALIVAQVVKGLYHILAVDLITLAQAVDVMDIEDQLSNPSRKLYQDIRKNFKVITHDRDVTADLERFEAFLKNYF